MIKKYSRYNIKETDRFDPNYFPKIQLELDDILIAAKGTSSLHKEDMLIAYLKKQTLEKEWTDSNPGLNGLLTGGTLVSSHMEALFESGQGNKFFLQGFEEYIRETLAQTAA
jgi:hypothetical protein